MACLIDYEDNTFSFTGDVEKDLSGITAVHPMREEAVKEFISNAKADWTVIDKLIAQGRLAETTHGNKKFYIRKL